jgi:prepilin-type N-terminal cleavage/methylation domain-containing protein
MKKKCLNPIFKKTVRYKGFTLLESMIAMVLLAAILIPIYVFFAQNMKGLTKASNKVYQVSATDQILNYMKTINPMESSKGSMDFGFFSIDYESKALLKDREIITASKDGKQEKKEASKETNSPFSEPENGVINLYDTLIDVTQNGEEWFSFSLRQIGFKLPKKEDHESSENSSSGGDAGLPQNKGKKDE